MKTTAIAFVVAVGLLGSGGTTAETSNMSPRKQVNEVPLSNLRSRHEPYESKAANNAVQKPFDQRSTELKLPGASGTRRLGDDTTNSNLICVAGDQNNVASPLKVTNVEFWYGVETNSSDVSSFLFTLEEQIFSSVSPQILWCYEPSNTTGTSNAGTRRNLEMTELDRRRQLAVEEARRLGIVSFSSGPADVITSSPCPFNYTSQNCFVLEGLLSLLAHSTDNLDYTVKSILKSVEAVMDDNLLLSATKLPTVSRIVYLGPNETDALSGAFLDGKDASEGGNKNVTIVGIQGGGGGGRDNRMLTLLAIPIIGVLAILLLLLRQRRTSSMKGILLEEDDFDDDDYVMVGTGDPPGSFHHGNYHYMADGTHYLSTNCIECYQTRRRGSYVYSDRDLPTILEHEVFDDDSYDRYRHLVAANSKDLGARHSGADVHQCKSGVCEVCQAAHVTFIPTSVRQFDPKALARIRDEAVAAPETDDHDDATFDGSIDYDGISRFETGVEDSGEHHEV